MPSIQSVASYVSRILKHSFTRTLALGILFTWILSAPLSAQEEPKEPSVPNASDTPSAEKFSLEEDEDSAGTSSSKRPADPSAKDLLIRVGLTLTCLILVLVGIAWVARRFWPGGIHIGRGTGPIRILARTGLPPRHTLYLIRVGRRILLVGVTGESISTLSEITDAEEVDRLEVSATGSLNESLPPGFEKVLSGALDQYEDDSPTTIPENLREL